MKILYTLIIAAITLTAVACNKETVTTQTEVMNNMLRNKNWYLDYSITGTSTKSYVGQTTYFVTYLKDGTTNDSDGLTGTYTVEIINNQSQIHVQVKTSNGNPLEYIYNIITVGDTKLVLEKTNTGQSTPTQLFFNSK
jgi:hypothetical protein